MKQFSKIMLLALGFGLLAAALSSIPSKPAAAAGAAPVFVTNTGANPVPVSLQGTGSISGSVNANVTNDPLHVSFNGTAQPVSPSNTSSTPLFVDTDGPARNRVQASCQSSVFSDAGSGGCGIATVPANQLLVIETVTVNVTLGAGKAIDNVHIDVSQVVSGSPQKTVHYLAVSRVGSNGIFDFYVITAPVRLYADGGTTVSVATLTESTGNVGNIYASISGHLVTP